ncbi:hypothetical protein DFH27DRAFT_602653 [Peziza echinospora]|nr:hypothetical protein DFH27DRAFT_602653 [Peziza echinospora]
MDPRTPRLPSSFPATPQPAPRATQQARPIRRPASPQRAQLAGGTPPKGTDAVPGPYIPTHIVDAPTQRFYAITVFVVLQAIKLADLASLWTDDADSVSELWFCIKWVMVDGGFCWLLPFLRIPWLTFHHGTTVLQILALFAVNVWCSYKFPFPFAFFFTGLWKFVYDRELSLSEQNVKIWDLTHNASHIQGKYTVHILPEGAAMLNPDGQCFCLEELSSSFVTIPIRINSTEPQHIQLTRADFETGEIQIIDIKEKEAKKLLKSAIKGDDQNIRTIQYTIKQPGLYRLTKVKDISQLDVRVTSSQALVVQCPKASVKVSDTKSKDRCSGDLSDLSVVIEGLAPLDIKYSRIVKETPITFAVSRIYTENFQSPLLTGWNPSEPLIKEGSVDISWGKRQRIAIPLNESLASAGDWTYAIDTVKDACGNLISYTKMNEDGDKQLPKAEHLAHTFTVHGRPQVNFMRCDPLNPSSLPPGRTTNLQFQLDFRSGDSPYNLQYEYSPHEKAEIGSPINDAVTKDFKIKGPSTTSISIDKSGIYTLKSISNKYCAGEVMEPSTCLVITPPRPSVSITHDNILDKCSASSVGVTIDVTLVGTPNFRLWYRLIRDGTTTEVKKFDIDRTRYQASIRPAVAGHYVYEFYQLDDKWNEGLVLDPTTFRIEQTIKPLAGASFAEPVSLTRKACIEEPVEFLINLVGIGPWTLSYSLLHNGKQKKYVAKEISESPFTITTPRLDVGGKYSLALNSVTDVSGCKIFLDAEAKIDVRFEKPKAGFGNIEGRMYVDALEGKDVAIPLRMRGEKPWTLRTRNLDTPDEPPIVQIIEESNSHLRVNKAGTYELMDVRDVASCPGIINESASKFGVKWIPRPIIQLSESSVQMKERDGLYNRKEICEGDEDSLELQFKGRAPYQATYMPAIKAQGGTAYVRGKVLPVHSGLDITSVRLDSTTPGVHRYEFLSITDSLYDDPKEGKLAKPLVLQQVVNAKPSAKFEDTGRMYKYCRDEGAGDDNIPIILTGVPPFNLQLTIKHHSTGKSEVVNIPSISETRFNFKVPPRALTLGSHSVSVNKVRDSRGCSRKTPVDAPSVYVAVADLPTITAEEPRQDYCVGNRISYQLSGSPPFSVEYIFDNAPKRASTGTRFSRVAPGPGNFTIIGLGDSASDCKVNLQLTKMIHEIPSVRISEGTKGIHEGDQAEILFQFFGTPPFTFTYTRSEIPKKGGRPRVMEQHSHTTDEYTYSMYASQEGTYEVTSIEDKYCSYEVKGKK